MEIEITIDGRSAAVRVVDLDTETGYLTIAWMAIQAASTYFSAGTTAAEAAAHLRRLATSNPRCGSSAGWLREAEEIEAGGRVSRRELRIDLCDVPRSLMPSEHIGRVALDAMGFTITDADRARWAQNRAAIGAQTA